MGYDITIIYFLKLLSILLFDITNERRKTCRKCRLVME